MLSFRLFADDANIFCAAKTPKDLEAVMKPELQKVINYCNLNKLSILTIFQLPIIHSVCPPNFA